MTALRTPLGDPQLVLLGGLLVNQSLEKECTKSFNTADTKCEEKDYPELKYRGKLPDIFYEFILNKNMPVETAIILGCACRSKS